MVAIGVGRDEARLDRMARSLPMNDDALSQRRLQ